MTSATSSTAISRPTRKPEMPGFGRPEAKGTGAGRAFLARALVGLAILRLYRSPLGRKRASPPLKPRFFGERGHSSVGRALQWH